MKQVIVVNAALKLPKGKLAAQVAHAAVAAVLNSRDRDRKLWLREGMPKVVVKGINEEELIQLQSFAQKRDIPVCLIRDAGKTVVQAGTITCLGIGPAEDIDVDSLTGALKLL